MIDICFGLNAIQSIISKEPKRIIELLIQKERHDNRINRLKQLATQHNIHYKYADKSLLNKLAPSSHQGVVAKVSSMESLTDKDLMSLLDTLEQPPLLLILDGITDPHNLGACLRTASAAGVDAVIIPKDRSAWLNATAVKVASGAAELIPLVRVTNLARTIDQLKDRGIWITGAVCDVEQTNSIYATNLTNSLAIVVGSEGRGIRRLTQDKCDSLIFIPMAKEMNSLNVSVASGVILFEAQRQRNSLK